MARPSASEAVDWTEAWIETASTCARSQRSSQELRLVADSGACFSIICIGEALKGLPADLPGLAGTVLLKSIIGQRTILAHQYWNVDVDEVWSTILNDLPILRGMLPEIRALVSEISAIG